jgi:hypothetical protein
MYAGICHFREIDLLAGHRQRTLSRACVEVEILRYSANIAPAVCRFAFQWRRSNAGGVLPFR